MTEEKTKGLLLQSIPYLAGRRILKVLTPDSGLVSIMAFAKTSPSLTTPFLLAEWVFAKDSRDIHRFKDGSLIDNFSSLKQDYDRLKSAGQIARDLLRTQMPGKSAAEILPLTIACLQKLPLFSNPNILATSFRLKLLSCEGLLHPGDLTTPFLQTLALSRSFRELASLTLEESGLKQVEMLMEERFELLRK